MYDHNVKAGNEGDVIKHTALMTAASLLMEKIEKTFHYADTFAGYAYNPLKSDGEWPRGIGALYDSGVTLQNPAVSGSAILARSLGVQSWSSLFCISRFIPLHA